MKMFVLTLAAAGLLASGMVTAQTSAHVHGQVQVDVVVDGAVLSVTIEAPLETLVGFEHRPRTVAQRQAAAQALAQFNALDDWLRLPTAAQCTLTRRSVDADALNPASAGARDEGHDHGDHADAVAQADYRCAAPAALTTLDLRLFASFPRMRRIEVRVAGASGQGKQTLRPPMTTVRLTR